MAGRISHPQYSKRRVGEPLRAYARRVNAKYDDDWAMKARERRAQHAARLPTPDQDEAIRHSIESNAARWKLEDDDVWLVRARLAHGGPRRPRSQPQPRQRPRRTLNIEYPEAQSLSDYESDSGSESGHLLPDCDSESDGDRNELCAAPALAFFPRRRIRPSPQLVVEPLRTKRRREDEDDTIITNDIKRCKTEPAVRQAEPIRTSSKRRRDDGDCDEKETMRSSKRQRIQQDPPSPPTDTEPALAAIPSPISDGFSQKTTVTAENTKRVRERPGCSRTGLPRADAPPQGRKRTSRSSVLAADDRSATGRVLPQSLLEGSRMTRRSGTVQLYQLDDRGRPMLQKVSTRVPPS